MLGIKRRYHDPITFWFWGRFQLIHLKYASDWAISRAESGALNLQLGLWIIVIPIGRAKPTKAED